MKSSAFFICLLFLLTIFLSGAGTAAGDEMPTFTPFPFDYFYETVTPEPGAGAIVKTLGKDEAEMVYIPAGSFLMGLDDDTALSASKPSHQVILKGFWIDRYEVSNAQFTKCVQSGYCYMPRDVSSSTRTDYFTNTKYAEYPVIHVDWNQAYAYCAWAGKRLPTEAEWEKAARGTDGRLYPWGNDLPDELPMQVNLFGEGDTAPVNSFPQGASPYGAYNMEGNVWEWTADQYDPYYYSKSPSENPKSVTGGNEYSIRGYSWAYPFRRYEISSRNSSYILNHTYDLGFRCVMDE